MSATRETTPRQDELQAWMAAAQKGDAEAYRLCLETLTGILRVYVPRILRRMNNLRAEVVEDLVQEVLLAIHEKRHTYDASQPLLPWFFAIARYKTIDFGRRQKRKGFAVDLNTVEDALASPVFEEAGTDADLQRLLSQLPEKPRFVLELVKLRGLSIAEAAAQAQMSESAIKVTVHRAIKRLRELSGGAK